MGGEALMPQSARVDVDVFGVPIVKRRLVRLRSRLVDASPAFKQVVGVLRSATAENFRTRGVSGGSRWRDLKPATIARKARLRQDERILRASGRLYGSLIGPAAGATAARDDRGGRFIPGGGEHVEEITATSLKWGSRVPYGVYHQSTAPRRVIPYRPPVRLSQRQRREVAKALQRALVS